MWRINQVLLGTNFGVVSYKVHRCLESPEEMAVVINDHLIAKGFKVKKFLFFEEKFAYFFLEPL